MSGLDSESIIERWREGVVFSIAWLVLADPDIKQGYYDAQKSGGQLAHRLLMVGDLWAGLRDDQFEAFGKCVRPKVSDGPVRLPAYMFEFEPPRGVADSDDIEVSGWKYEGVKVAIAVLSEVDRVPVVPLKLAPSEIRGGRPNTYEKAAKVLRTMFARSGDVGLSPEKLHPLFAIEFERLFPREAFMVATPALRTFQNHLKRFRQEVAKTRKNHSAS